MSSWQLAHIQWLLITACPSACFACSVDGSCLSGSCYPGYYNSGTGCTQCAGSYCQTCTSSGCMSQGCQVGYGLNYLPSDLQCHSEILTYLLTRASIYYKLVLIYYRPTVCCWNIAYVQYIPLCISLFVSLVPLCISLFVSLVPLCISLFVFLVPLVLLEDIMLTSVSLFRLWQLMCVQVCFFHI